MPHVSNPKLACRPLLFNMQRAGVHALAAEVLYHRDLPHRPFTAMKLQHSLAECLAGQRLCVGKTLCVCREGRTLERYRRIWRRQGTWRLPSQRLRCTLS